MGGNETHWVLRECDLLGKAAGPLGAISRGQSPITEGDAELPPTLGRSPTPKHYRVTCQTGLRETTRNRGRNLWALTLWRWQKTSAGSEVAQSHKPGWLRPCLTSATCEVWSGPQVPAESKVREPSMVCRLLGGTGPETFGFSVLHLFSIIQEKGMKLREKILSSLSVQRACDPKGSGQESGHCSSFLALGDADRLYSDLDSALEVILAPESQ